MEKSNNRYFIEYQNNSESVLKEIDLKYQNLIKNMIFPSKKLYLINRHLNFNNIQVENAFQDALKSIFKGGAYQSTNIPLLTESLEKIKEIQQKFLNFLQSEKLDIKDITSVVNYDLKLNLKKINEFDYLKCPITNYYPNFLFCDMQIQVYLKYFEPVASNYELNKLEDKLYETDIIFNYNELNLITYSTNNKIIIRVVKEIKDGKPIYWSKKYFVFSIIKNDIQNKSVKLELFWIKDFNIGNKLIINPEIKNFNKEIDIFLSKQSFDICRPGDIVTLSQSDNSEIDDIFQIISFKDSFQTVLLKNLKNLEETSLSLINTTYRSILPETNYKINRKPFFLEDIIYDSQGKVIHKNKQHLKFNYFDKQVTINKKQLPEYDLIQKMELIEKENNNFVSALSSKKDLLSNFVINFYQLAIKYNQSLLIYYQSLHQLSLQEFPSTKFITTSNPSIIYPKFNKTIIIIGSGPVGLMSAIKLKKTFRNTRIIIVDNRTIDSNNRKQYDRFQMIDLNYDSLKKENDLIQYLMPILHRSKGNTNSGLYDGKISTISIVIRLLETILNYYCLNLGIEFSYQEKDYSIDEIIKNLSPILLLNCSGKQKINSKIINIQPTNWIKNNLAEYKDIEIYQEPNVFKITIDNPFYLMYDQKDNYYKYINQDGNQYIKYTSYLYSSNFPKDISRLSGFVDFVNYKDNNNLVINFSEKNYKLILEYFNKLNVNIVNNKMLYFNEIFYLIFEDLLKKSELIELIESLKSLNDIVITRPWSNKIQFSAKGSQLIENKMLYLILGQAFDLDYFGVGDGTNKWFRFLDNFILELNKIDNIDLIFNK